MASMFFPSCDRDGEFSEGEQRKEDERRGGGEGWQSPSQTAYYTPAAASPCVWSWSWWSPVWWPTAADLWDPEDQSRRTRWGFPLCRTHTSLRTRTSRSPEEQKKFLYTPPAEQYVIRPFTVKYLCKVYSYKYDFQDLVYIWKMYDNKGL